VDARLHHLQGKTKGVTPSELQSLIRDFYVERVALLMQHEAAARHISDYDVNNAYQYVIAREETHVSWLQHALLHLGSVLPPDPAPRDVKPTGKGTHAELDLMANDARDNQQFVTRWRDRVEKVTNARHQGMLRVVLGEMLEHKRLFEQAAAGRTDITGTALPINERRGKVIDTRWVE
jgi:hypothetical protein